MYTQACNIVAKHSLSNCWKCTPHIYIQHIYTHSHTQPTKRYENRTARESRLQIALHVFQLCLFFLTFGVKGGVSGSAGGDVSVRHDYVCVCVCIRVNGYIALSLVARCVRWSDDDKNCCRPANKISDPQLYTHGASHGYS